MIDPQGGAQLAAEAEAYRKDLRAAVERSIALSPVAPVRDGTFHYGGQSVQLANNERVVAIL